MQGDSREGGLPEWGMAQSTPCTAIQIWSSPWSGHSEMLLYVHMHTTSTLGWWMGCAWATVQSSCTVCSPLPYIWDVPVLGETFHQRVQKKMHSSVNTPAADWCGHLKLEQIKGTQSGIMDLLGNVGSCLYAKPLSMTKFFDTMIVSACHIGDMPKWGCCKDLQAATWVYEEEKCQVIQKILSCLHMRVMDGNLVMPLCLHTDPNSPT